MLTTDELYEIMINLPIQDLQSLCTTNHFYNNLCSNGDFWKNKLQHDHLPLFNNPISLQDYVKIQQANDIKKTYENQTYFNINFTNEDLSSILSSNIYNQIPTNYDEIILYFHLYKTTYFKL